MRALTVFLAAFLLTGCSLRPRYSEFVGKETVGPVKLQVVEKKSGLPVAGAAIEVGEQRVKVSMKTDADGFFTLPVDKKLMDENALIVVTVPPGVGRTRISVASSEPMVAPHPMPAPESAPAVGLGDAGTSVY